MKIELGEEEIKVTVQEYIKKQFDVDPHTNEIRIDGYLCDIPGKKAQVVTYVATWKKEEDTDGD